jgi:hypothetical protein
MRRTARVAVFALLVLTTQLPAFEMDVGAGITIDVAPFGIESVEPLVFAAPWIGPRDTLQVGVVAVGSFGAGTSDAALALCARMWPVKNIVALYGGAGVLAALGQDPSLMPYVLGGLRLEAGRFAFIVPGLAVRFKPAGSDTEVCLCEQYSV